MNKNVLYFTLATIAFSPSISAQSALEEVVVTAQRREESLQEVPVSITAFSGEAMQEQNLNEAKDYFKMTPNVNFTEDGETGARSVGISMRGVSDFANSFTGVGGLSNSFGIYLDEFNIANNATKKDIGDATDWLISLAFYSTLINPPFREKHDLYRGPRAFLLVNVDNVILA